MRFLHRIRVEGMCEAADRLRLYLHKAGFLLVLDSSAGYTLTLSDGPSLTLDSVDSDLERAILRNLQELDEKKQFPGCSRVTIVRAGGNQEPDAATMTAPAGLHDAVAIALLRAIVQTSDQPAPPASAAEAATVRRPWWRFWAVAWLLLWAGTAHAQDSFARLDANTGVTVDARFFVGIFSPSASGPVAVALPTALGANGGIKVDIVGSTVSSGGTSATDNSAFTVDVGSGTPAMGYVGTDTVTAGRVGVPGMLGNRQLKVTLFDSGGTELAVGGGTQYTEDAAAAANPIGNAVNLVRADTPGAVATTDGDNVAQRGTNYGAAYVTLLDTGGSPLAVGGGTQYTEDAAAAANPVGNALNLVRADALAGLTTTDGDNVAARGTDKGELYVKHVDAIPATQSGTWDEVGINDSGNSITVDASNLDVQSGGADLATETTAAAILTSTNYAAAFGTAGTADTQVMSVQGIAGMTAVTVSATNLDVQIGGSDTVTVTDGSGAMNVIVDSGTVTTVSTVTTLSQLGGVALPVEDAGETAAGVGIYSMTVRRDVAAASAGATGDNATANTDALGLLWGRTLDPCSGVAKTYLPIDIVTATTTEITPSLAGASTHYYICSINLVTAAANNVAVVDDNTDGCGSPTAGIFGGFGSAAEGWNFAAGGGIALGSGSSSVGRTTTSNAVICIISSAATQLSGMLVVVAAP